MKLKGLVDEDIVNYSKTSMYLIFPTCDFKCERDCGKLVCQNSSLISASVIEIEPDDICNRYINNPLTSAIVCGGLEPFDSRFELLQLVDCLRRKYNCEDNFIIYTGYTEEELTNEENSALHQFYKNLLTYNNIIIKFGRFVPGEEKHFDEVLGVFLTSNNQYAKKVS